MDVFLFMCLSVLDNSAVAEPLTVRPLVIFMLVNETLSVCKIKGSLQRHTAVSEGAAREYKTEQTRVFFSFTV